MLSRFGLILPSAQVWFIFKKVPMYRTIFTPEKLSRTQLKGNCLHLRECFIIPILLDLKTKRYLPSRVLWLTVEIKFTLGPRTKRTSMSLTISHCLRLAHMLQSQPNLLYSQMTLGDLMFLNEPKLLENYYLIINNSKGKKMPRAKITYFQRTSPRDIND